MERAEESEVERYGQPHLDPDTRPQKGSKSRGRAGDRTAAGVEQDKLEEEAVQGALRY